MQKIKITKPGLVSLNREIETWVNEASFLAIIHRTNIDYFFKHNRHKVDAVKAEMLALDDKYFVYETEGEKRKLKIVGEGPDRKPELLPFKTWEQFNEEKKKLFEETVEISVI